MKYLIIIWVWSAGFPNCACSQIHTAKDSLRLYFPLKEYPKDSVNVLDTFVNIWYSRMLSAMKEPVLANLEEDKEVIRFTWLRTFHHPVAIRIQKEKNKITLTAKVLNGAGGYEPGKIILNKTIKINEEKWKELQAGLGQIHFFKLPTEIDELGFDGSEWILEVATKHNYHFIARWSPGPKSEYGKYCLQLLTLSGIHEKEIY
ncbi:MAG: hypothetical protein J7578_04835 [Chitinophagaceae bacterium]|nr:hypothetical protein [Chitinophagaceae bacterium]